MQSVEEKTNIGWECKHLKWVFKEVIKCWTREREKVDRVPRFKKMTQRIKCDSHFLCRRFISMRRKRETEIKISYQRWKEKSLNWDQSDFLRNKQQPSHGSLNPSFKSNLQLYFRIGNDTVHYFLMGIFLCAADSLVSCSCYGHLVNLLHCIIEAQCYLTLKLDSHMFSINMLCLLEYNCVELSQYIVMYLPRK